MIATLSLSDRISVGTIPLAVVCGWLAVYGFHLYLSRPYMHKVKERYVTRTEDVCSEDYGWLMAILIFVVPIGLWFLIRAVEVALWS